MVLLTSSRKDLKRTSCLREMTAWEHMSIFPAHIVGGWRFPCRGLVIRVITVTFICPLRSLLNPVWLVGVAWLSHRLCEARDTLCSQRGQACSWRLPTTIPRRGRHAGRTCESCATYIFIGEAGPVPASVWWSAVRELHLYFSPLLKYK